MEKTLEEILLEQLEQPVRLKNGSVAENPRTGVYIVNTKKETILCNLSKIFTASTNTTKKK